MRPFLSLSLAVAAAGLTACASLDPFADAPPTKAEILASARTDIAEHCLTGRDTGRQSYVAAAACSNQATLKAFHDIGYRYMDLVVKVNTERLVLADKVDRREITPVNYSVELSQAWAAAIHEENLRLTAFGRKPDRQDQLLSEADLFL